MSIYLDYTARGRRVQRKRAKLPPQGRCAAPRAAAGKEGTHGTEPSTPQDRYVQQDPNSNPAWMGKVGEHDRSPYTAEDGKGKPATYLEAEQQAEAQQAKAAKSAAKAAKG